MTQTLLAIGTRKGLWLARSDDRSTWTLDGPHHLMREVPSIGIDVRNGSPRLLVGFRSEHWGPTIVRSDDLGQSWDETFEGAMRFPEDTGAAVERVWQIAPDIHDDEVVWASTEPQALWRSTDRGEKFSLVRGLWEHPHRAQWGAGDSHCGAPVYDDGVRAGVVHHTAGSNDYSPEDSAASRSRRWRSSCSRAAATPSGCRRSAASTASNRRSGCRP